MTDCLLDATGCLSKSEDIARSVLARTEIWKRICCDDNPLARIWLDEFNPEWIDRRPYDPEPTKDDERPFAKFPLIVIDSHQHTIRIGGTQVQELGELNVYVGLQIPESFADKVVLRHPVNARRYITNITGKLFAQAADIICADSIHVAEIKRAGGVSNQEHEWNDPEIGRYHWEIYGWNWGWQE